MLAAHISRKRGLMLNIPKLAKVAFISVFLMLLSLSAHAAQGTTFDIPDGDVQALIDAINAANDEAANPGPDIINLAEGGGYTLTAVIDETDGANGLPSITSEITLNGNGATIERSAAEDMSDFRILHVSEEGELTLDSITVSNGSVASDSGGIFNARSGGIFNAGAMMISNSSITGNTAEDIGGIGNIGAMTISNSSITGNTAEGAGGIGNIGAMTISNSSITGNIAEDIGGIFNDGAMTISDSTLSGNASRFGSGGGIWNGDIGEMTISDSTVSGNFTEFDGSGIFNVGAMTISDSTLSGNSARSDGGGIFNGDAGEMTISNSTVSGNFARFGGGIHNTGEMTISNSSITGNFAGFGDGGGIFNGGEGELTISNSTLSGNTARLGGGIDNFGELIISNSTLSGNFAVSGGGVVNSDTSAPGTLEIKNSIIANSLSGGDCFERRAILSLVSDNLDTDGTCLGFTQVTSDALNLGPLADNDGPTQTHALLPGSVAIDAATDCADIDGNPLEFDQRGVARPQGAACDIGAFEMSEAG